MRGPETDHVIPETLRCLKKTAPNGANRHPDRHPDRQTDSVKI